jgi:hypothetical protein
LHKRFVSISAKFGGKCMFKADKTGPEGGKWLKKTVEASENTG